jgi:hypothetical protein
MKITLPNPRVAQLEALAEERGEPVARVAARMIEAALAGGEPHQGRVSTPERRLPARTAPDQRPPWLEPYGGDREWRVLIWAAIVALHGRYSHALAFLKEGWWEDAAHLETLCALVVWRDWIDDYGDDPRYELAFHAQLEDFGRGLRQEGGGISSTWKPGAPPDGWTR